jgi:Family of unknown function (DUF6286)
MTLTTESARVPDVPDASADPESALEPAREPVGTGASPLVAQLLALVLIALGIVGIQEALVRTDAVSTSSWTRQALDAVDGLEATAWWLLPVCAGLGVLGLLLLVVAFRRRPRKTLALGAQTGVFLRRGALPKIVTSAVEGTDGVTDVDTTCSRSRIKVRATTFEARDGNSAIEADIRTRLEGTLAALHPEPRLTVDITNEDIS